LKARVFRQRSIEIKSDPQLLKMREAGLIVAECLDLLAMAAAPGVTTRELDGIAEDQIRTRGGIPNFLGYHGYPATICASVNDRVVHGIPDDTPLMEGDALSIDCGCSVDGWHGDAAITVPIGRVSADVERMIEVCDGSLWAGLEAARLGGRVSDISHAVESHVRERGDYGILEDYVGHGIGSAMHMHPAVPNYGPPGRGPSLERGMALAVEPMITMGTIDTEVLDDDWTVVTSDGSWSAHFEHSFTLTPSGPVVLTALDGGAARLGEYQIAVGELAEIRA
jgi:methionyl aminopeptidase